MCSLFRLLIFAFLQVFIKNIATYWQRESSRYSLTLDLHVVVELVLTPGLSHFMLTGQFADIATQSVKSRTVNLPTENYEKSGKDYIISVHYT